MKTMNNVNNNQSYNGTGRSCYFGGEFCEYALHQWNIKYYRFEADWEVETALNYAFGPNLEILTDLLGYEAEFSIEGRSGGWLCTDAELSFEEVKIITNYVQSVLRELPKVLDEERNLMKEVK